MKCCTQCGESKPRNEFYKHPKMPDGILNQCKSCVKARVAKHRAENIDAIREYDRSRANEPHRVAARKAYQPLYRAAHPDRDKAKGAVNNAVRDGRLKPYPCFICGRKAEAHHPDYSRPLDVVWLCPPHHKQAHALVRNDVKSAT